MKPFFRSRRAVWGVVSLSMILVASAGLSAYKTSKAASDAAQAAHDAAAIADDPGVHKVAAADTAFGLSLLTVLAKAKPHENIFVSPFSISAALTLALNGAGGTTPSDIAKTLSLQGIPIAEINEANRLLLASFKNPDPLVHLSIGNALWADRSVVFKSDYQAVCQRFYSAKVESLDFASPSSINTINGWVSRQTEGKIESIVKPGDLTGVPMVLTNAVYFHGKWTTPFKKGQTQDGPFAAEDRTKKTLPFMNRTGFYSYAKTDQFQEVRLPYGAGRFALYVFLPRPPYTLDTFLKALTALKWDALLAKMPATEIVLDLPRFRVTEDVTLNDALSQLGMAAAFKPGADFSPMGLQNGAIGKVVHKAVLEVDEEGTVAAAVSADQMATSALPASSDEMRVDHPFFIAIRDDTSGTLLFVGAIRNP